MSNKMLSDPLVPGTLPAPRLELWSSGQLPSLVPRLLTRANDPKILVLSTSNPQDLDYCNNQLTIPPVVWNENDFLAYELWNVFCSIYCDYMLKVKLKHLNKQASRIEPNKNSP